MAVDEGLRVGGLTSPPQFWSISFRWCPETPPPGKGGQEGVVWGLTTSYPQSKRVAGCSLTGGGVSPPEQPGLRLENELSARLRLCVRALAWAACSHEQAVLTSSSIYANKQGLGVGGGVHPGLGV